jgi:hypothetical protein
VSAELRVMVKSTRPVYSAGEGHMRRWICTIAAAALLVSAARAQSAGTQAQGTAAGNAAADSGATSAALEAGTAVEASLSKSVDAKKAKPGDPVEARVEKDVKSAGRVVVPKGAKLVGHVTQAQAREKGNADSQLGIVFDRAVLKNGGTVAFQGVIRTLSAAPQVSGYSGDDTMASAGAPGYEGSSATMGEAPRSPAGGAIGGLGNTAGSVAGNAGSAVSGAAGAAANAAGSAGAGLGASGAGAVGATAPGIRGLPGLQIDAAASTAANGTVIVSHNRNVHLDSGTQLVIQVTTQ